MVFTVFNGTDRITATFKSSVNYRILLKLQNPNLGF